jgi:hypothetical protein
LVILALVTLLVIISVDMVAVTVCPTLNLRRSMTAGLTTNVYNLPLWSFKVMELVESSILTIVTVTVVSAGIPGMPTTVPELNDFAFAGSDNTVIVHIHSVTTTIRNEKDFFMLVFFKFKLIN